jgi:Hydrazine synthase alpha subunit middle domain
MSLPERPSSSRSPGAEGAGRAVLAVVLGVALSLLGAAGGFLGLRGIGGPPAGTLVTVEGPHSAGGSEAVGTHVSFSARGGTLSNLTKDFFSAFASSVSYDGRRFLFAGRQTPMDAPAIWERGTDGARLRKVTGGNGDPAGAVYLPDGRILYSDLPASGTATRARSLFSCAPGGGDIHQLTFSEQRDFGPRVLEDGRIRFRRQVLSPPDPEGVIREMVMHPDGTGLSLLTEPAARGDAPEDLPEPKAPAGERFLSSIRTAPRAVPPVLTSVIRAEWKTGTLLCLNVYESRLPAVAGLPPGSIQRVRITARNAAGDELAGEAPVMSDGSFFVEVPADTPLKIHLLGQGGKILASFESGIHVRPNENHGCIGCHEDPEMAPENAQPLAVRHPPVSLLLSLTRKGAGDGK